MSLWNGKKKSEMTTTGGGEEFERAAAAVSAELPEDRAAAEPAAVVEENESLLIRPEWAEAAARFCFLPAARFSHPAYALSDEEAEKIAPLMQTFLQAVADKYAPAALGRVANKYPEFFDLAAALGVLYWQKWRYVSHLRQMEAQERAEAAEAAAGSGSAPAPARPVRAGERDSSGVLII